MAYVHARMKRLIFAWIAVSTALLVTACGKSDERSLPTPPALPPQQQAQQEVPEATTSPAPEVEEGAVDDEEGFEEPIASEPAPADEGGAGNEAVPTQGGALFNPSGKTPKEIFDASARLGSVASGMKAGKDLFYTGSGQDRLRERITAMVNSQKEAAQRVRNLQFASEIALTTFEFVQGQPKVSITLRGKNGARQELPNVYLKPQGRQGYAGFEKTQSITVDAVCMDASSVSQQEGSGCKTAHVRLQRKVKGGVAVAHVLARTTTAYFYVQGNPPGSSNNHEYDTLMGMFLKSVYRPGASGTIQSLAFYSTEVINGASEFAVIMSASLPDARTGRLTNQLIGWQGPLVKPARTTSLRLSVKAPNVTREVRGRKEKVPFRDLGASTVVRNDGRGNMQFNIAVGRRNPEVIRLTIARIHTPTRTEIVLR